MSDPKASAATLRVQRRCTDASSVRLATGIGSAGSVRLRICRPSSEAEATTAYEPDPILTMSTADAPPRTVAPSSATDDMTLGLGNRDVDHQDGITI